MVRRARGKMGAERSMSSYEGAAAAARAATRAAAVVVVKADGRAMRDVCRRKAKTAWLV